MRTAWIVVALALVAVVAVLFVLRPQQATVAAGTPSVSAVGATLSDLWAGLGGGGGSSSPEIGQTDPHDYSDVPQPSPVQPLPGGEIL